MDSTDVRIARMEEVQKAIAKNQETNHREVLGVLKALSSETKKNSEDVLILKRDRFWLFTLGGSALSMAVWAVMSIFGIQR